MSRPEKYFIPVKNLLAVEEQEHIIKTWKEKNLQEYFLDYTSSIEKIIEKIDIPKVYDAYLDIYFQLDDLEFWEFVEDEFTIGLIRYPEHQKLELMVVVPSN